MASTPGVPPARAICGPCSRPCWPTAWLAAGDARQALQAAEAGLAGAQTGERVWVPELHRLRALALARLGEPESARDSLRSAVATAEQMGASAWRERALADLAGMAQGERNSP